MLRILLAVSSVGLLLVCFALGTWYLMHPDSWNWRSRGELLPEASKPAPEPVVIESRFVSDPPAASRSSTNVANVTNTAVPPRVPAPAAAPRAFSEESVSAACSLPDTVSVTRRANAVIYSWRDERGVFNYSSEPPRSPTIPVRTINYWTDPEYFDLSIEYRGADTIPEFRTELSQDATGIYKVLSRLVGENNLRKVDLNIVIYPSRAAYLQYANSSTGRNMGTTAGFYSTRTNEAVTYIQAQREAMLQTARHEATHVVVTGILGLVPPWLHEGLAEYFSRLDVVGQVERISVDEQALQLVRTSLRGGYPRRLRDFLALSSEAWRGNNQTTHYALAEGLLFFMMSNDARRRALASLLNATAAQYCRQLDTTALLNEFYPGGIATLERDFAAWLQDSRPKATHEF